MNFVNRFPQGLKSTRKRAFEIYTDHLYDPVFIIDASMELKYFNESFLTFVKLPPRRIPPGTILDKIISCEFLDDRNVQKCILNKAPVTSTEVTVRVIPTDLKYECLVRITPVISAGIVLETQVVIHDISVEKSLHNKYRDQLKKIRETQKQMAHIDRLAILGEISAEVAHELKNPLTLILGHADYLKNALKKAPLNKEDIEGSLNEIISGIERACVITDEIKNFSHKEDDVKKVCNCFGLLQSAVQLMLPKTKADGIELLLMDSQDSCQVFANTQKIEQVMLNLFSNAVGAVNDRFGNDSGGKIIVTMRVDPALGMVAIRVSDNGKGFEGVDTGQLYEPFYTTKKLGEGTGLGLSIVKNIVDWHEGTIDAVAEKSGAAFVITLPIHRSE